MSFYRYLLRLAAMTMTFILACIGHDTQIRRMATARGRFTHATLSCRRRRHIATNCQQKRRRRRADARAPAIDTPPDATTRRYAIDILDAASAARGQHDESFCGDYFRRCKIWLALRASATPGSDHAKISSPRRRRSRWLPPHDSQYALDAGA